MTISTMIPYSLKFIDMAKDRKHEVKPWTASKGEVANP